MSVTLRLSRGGTKKRPFYRIVAADKRSPRDGRFIERLGTYNPMKPKDSDQRVLINLERIKYWLSVGAKPTERVAKFLAVHKLYEKPEIRPQTKKDKPRKKTLEKIKAKEEKLATKKSEETNTGSAEKTAETAPAEKQAEAAPTEKTAETVPAEKQAEAAPIKKPVEEKPTKVESKD